ncbi:MAG TPA: hypothetical protein VGB45_13595 [Abditibacterium sp.]|jgi:hypothetical protein
MALFRTSSHPSDIESVRDTRIVSRAVSESYERAPLLAQIRTGGGYVGEPDGETAILDENGLPIRFFRAGDKAGSFPVRPG